MSDMTMIEAGPKAKALGFTRLAVPAPTLVTKAPVPARRRRKKGPSQSAKERALAAGFNLVPCQGCKGEVWRKVPLTEPAPMQELPPAKAELISRTQARPSGTKPLTWAVGVTTVPERRSNGLLLLTLASLRAAGFDDPHFFVDGPDDGQWGVVGVWKDAGARITFRGSRIRTVANWHLAAIELLARNPTAERFVIFQDDVRCVRNLRDYLEAVQLPERSYFNLFTARSANENLIAGKRGWVRAALCDPSEPNLQKGIGALALMFTREGLQVCLSSPHWGRKMSDANEDHKGCEAGKGPRRWPDGTPRLMGQVRVDGAVVTAMNLAGWSEMVHAPSLVQHAGGFESSMGIDGQAGARSYPGDGFDAMSLLKNG